MKTRIPTLARVGTLAALAVFSAQAQVVQQWDFNNGSLDATGAGPALTYLDSAQTGTSFGTTTSFGIPNIGGAVANVAKFNGFTGPSGIGLPVTGSPNGGGSLINDWTIIMDLFFPAASDKKFRALVETDSRTLYPDAELFIGNNNGLGINGVYTGNLTANQWHRVAFVIDGENNNIRKYIDGAYVGVQSMGGSPQGGLDGRWAITPGAGLELFTDNNGEVAPGYVNSIQFRDAALTTGQIMALGAPTAAGVPETIPPIPAHIESSTPDVGSTAAAPQPNIEVVFNGGDSTIANGSVRLLFDDAPVNATVTPNGSSYTLAYTPPGLLDPESAHKVTVAYTENGAAKTASLNFSVVKYQNVTLPAPFYLETFDSLTENEFGPSPLPAGWTVSNQNTPQGQDYDLSVRSSKSYEDWALITTERFTGFGNARTALPPIVLNGTLLESLASGNLMWAESDQRTGNAPGQYQELYTADIDLTGRTNVYVAWHSIYEQNQDNMNAAEYSIDGGATWLPALYLFCRAGAGESSDIMYKDAPEGAEGTVIDAVKTFARTDNNRPWGPAPTGTNYGSMIKAPVSDALAPFIKGYFNDDVLDGKRIEIVRLAQADGKKVRFRFLNTGTSAWFWGIDDLGLYEINTPSITLQPAGATVDFGGTINLKVEATAGQTYQWFHEGIQVASATNSSLVISNVTAADAGSYRVTVRNNDGAVNSNPAVIDVVVAPRITTQPASVLVSAGAPISLSVAARGKTPLSYQWQKNGADIQNATNATFSVAASAVADSGGYTVVVSNDAGSATSSTVSVTVDPIHPVTDALVVHLKFDANATDSSTRGNNGEVVGSTTFGTGKIGGAVQIRATNDAPAYVTLGAPEDLNFGVSNDFSIAFWGKINGINGDASIIGNKDWDSGGNQGYVLFSDTNRRIAWNIAGPGGARRDSGNNVPNIFTDNTWAHVVITFDRDGNAIIYVNGERRHVLDISSNPIDLSTPSGFATNIGQDGAGDYGSFFSDLMVDDLGIWRRLLTPQEVASIYAKGQEGQDLTKASGEAVIVPPSITTSPDSQIASAGANVTLNVGVGGTAPFTYQWQKNGQDITGATGASLTLSNVTAAVSGEYRVVVSNAKGSATSASARLLVGSGGLSGDLVTYLKFNGDYSDASGRGNNAAAVGNPSFEGGKLGQALRVTSVKDGSRFAYATLGTNANLQFDTNSFSVSYWVNITSAEGDPSFIANKDWNSSSNPGWGVFGQGGGNIRVNATGTPASSANRFSVTAGPNIKDGNWHHVLVTFWRGVATSTYVDGQLINVSPLTITGSVDTGLPTNIGQDGKGNYTDGASVGMNALVDEVALWRRPLSTQEAAAIYAAGGAGNDLASLLGSTGGDIRITSVTRSGNNIAIAVSGGGNVQLQKKSSLSDATWTTVNATAANGVFTVAADGNAGFFRAVGQ